MNAAGLWPFLCKRALLTKAMLFFLHIFSYAILKNPWIYYIIEDSERSSHSKLKESGKHNGTQVE